MEDRFALERFFQVNLYRMLKIPVLAPPAAEAPKKKAKEAPKKESPR